MIYDEAMRTLVDLNIFNTLDGFYLTVGTDEWNAQQNWIQPLYNLTNNGLTYTATGYPGNGSGWLGTGFTPSQALENFSTAASHISVFNLTEAQSDIPMAGSLVDTPGALTSLAPRTTAGNFSGKVQDTNALTMTVSSALGAFAMDKNSSSYETIWADGTPGTSQIQTGSQTSSEIVFLRSGTNFSSNKMAGATFGGPVGYPNVGILRNIQRRFLVDMGVIAGGIPLQ